MHYKENMLSENSIISKCIVHYEYIIKMVQNTWSKKQQIHGCLGKTTTTTTTHAYFQMAREQFLVILSH